MSPRALYFELWDDMRVPGRWVLNQTNLDDQGRRLDPWQFTKGEPVILTGTFTLGVAHPGQPLDFSLTGPGTPVVSPRVVSLFERWGLQQEVQFLPARVEGHTTRYFILNALRILRCIDEARCEEIRFWEPRHGVPEKVGQYRNVVGLKVDPSRMGGTRIARPWGWRGALIVGEDLKRAMEAEGLTGPRFTEA